MSSEKPNSFSYFTLSSSFTPLVEIYGGLPITMSNFSLRQNIHSGSKKEDTEFWSYGFHSVICLTAASNPVISPLFCSLAISAFVAFMRTVSSLRFFLLMSSRNKESGHIDYTIDGANDKYDWNKSALRPLAVDKKFDFFNPKVGLNWNINSNHRVYASFSVAQKEPTRNNYTDGDPDSYPKAEKLLDYEAGYTFANHWLTAGANFYYMDYTDQLVLTGALNDIGEALTENVPDSYRMGIELMLGIKPCKWFQWDINATWSKNRIKNFVENIPIYDGWNLLDVVSVSHKSTRIAFSPDFLLNNRFAFTYQGFEAALQSQFVGKQYMTNAEVEALTLDKYFVTNLNLAYTFKPRKVVKEVTLGVTVYNLFNEEYENNGWASSSYDKDVNHRIDSAGYAAQAGTNVMGHVSFRF